MRFVSAIILSTFLCVGGIRAASQPHSGGGDPASASSTPPAASTQSDLQDLRDQVEKMKALVQQMEQNLGFVDSTQSPLKHQFQLEIDMWKTMIAEMEKKLNTSRRP